ncbi:hypothetical protein IJD44_06740 [bacterium]|nr:hypothetical protein [bacterium]
MRTLNDESLILEIFSDTKKSEVVHMGNIFRCSKIYYSLTSFLFRRSWKNSSGKDDPPPDFYNNKKKLMMDVMRIDDCAFVDAKGKVQNKTLQRESFIHKKLNLPERKDLTLFVVGDSGLRGEEDHNFKRYFSNFERVFKKHEEKLDLYKKNHPGFKTIFFIMDESSAYMEVYFDEDIKKKRVKGIETMARPHIYCCDKRFVDIIKNSKVDYVIWFAPYKLMEVKGIGTFPLPKCAIYDVKNIKDKYLIEYDEKKVISIEV